MVPIREAAVVQFLHWLDAAHPEIEEVRKLSDDEFLMLAREYEGTHSKPVVIPAGSNLEHKWIDVFQYLTGAHSHFSFRADTRIEPKERQPYDALRRYRDVPFKAMFFLTSEDKAAKAYVEEHWNALDGMSGSHCDIYIAASGDAYSQIKALSRIPGVSHLSPGSLPCLLIWTQTEWFRLGLSRKELPAHEMTETLRSVFSELWKPGAQNHRLAWWPLAPTNEPKSTIAHLRQAANIARTRIQTTDEEVDVFISYKRRLRSVVEVLASDLKRSGLSVWYDAELEPGGQFSADIKNRLDKAAVVIVCWSPDAFRDGGDTSGWVEAEAAYARDRFNRGSAGYIPILIEATNLGPPYNIDHTLDFSGWSTQSVDGRKNADAWKRLLAAAHPWRLTRSAA